MAQIEDIVTSFLNDVQSTVSGSLGTVPFKMEYSASLSIIPSFTSPKLFPSEGLMWEFVLQHLWSSCPKYVSFLQILEYMSCWLIHPVYLSEQPISTKVMCTVN